ncbi:MAG TPA: hypothetical protein VK662_15905 [Acidothermaceae bacterium]|jgi:hypothetical protein|nr:hypothetical protein [Acidothermaceae bacterium]
MTRIKVLALGGLVLLLAACSGGSSGSHVAQLASTASLSRAPSSVAPTSTQQGGAVGFAQCMRAHGVPKWPDPDSSGSFDKTKITDQQLGVGNTALQAAQDACQHLLPPESLTQQRLNAVQALQFAQCMRAHSVPKFPDPDGTGRIPDPATVGVDQGSPQFQAANDACAQYRPPYIPTNQQYDAYAATATAP